MNKQKGLAPVLIVLLIAVVVGGYLLYQKQTKPVPVSQTSPSSVASPVATSSAETANWEASSIREYSFKLPPLNWIIKDREGVVSVEEGWRQSTGSTGGEHISIRQISSGLDPQKYIINSLAPNSKPQNQGQISINGFLGEKWSYNVENTDNNFAIFFDHNNKKYVLSKEGNSIPEFANINKELDQILFTFKFTN